MVAELGWQLGLDDTTYIDWTTPITERAALLEALSAMNDDLPDLTEALVLWALRTPHQQISNHQQIALGSVGPRISRALTELGRRLNGGSDE